MDSTGTNSVISTVCVPASSSALISSGEKETYWSLANSYPFTIWSRSITEPCLRQMYCCLRRDPQSLCNRLNEIEFPDCVAEYSLAGIATSPNEIVRDPIDRAAIQCPLETQAYIRSLLPKASARLCF